MDRSHSSIVSIDAVERLGLLGTSHCCYWDVFIPIALACNRLHVGELRVHFLAICFFCDLQVNLLV